MDLFFGDLTLGFCYMPHHRKCGFKKLLLALRLARTCTKCTTLKASLI
ncbi:Uncharacterised protein [Vibrio cholerae]|nr:Uncharacterised protein [Vibrio cholerae]CSC69344.1 Uncharacterised protein [Vibrio cholerae]